MMCHHPGPSSILEPPNHPEGRQTEGAPPPGLADSASFCTVSLGLLTLKVLYMTRMYIDHWQFGAIDLLRIPRWSDRSASARITA